MAHLAVVCPRCRTRYQVEPGLRGLNMRCPNPSCRAVFEVQEEAADKPASVACPASPASPPNQVTGAVGEVVPMLSADVVAPPEPAALFDASRQAQGTPVPVLPAEMVAPPEPARPSDPPVRRKPAVEPALAARPQAMPAPPVQLPPVRLPPVRLQPTASQPTSSPTALAEYEVRDLFAGSADGIAADLHGVQEMTFVVSPRTEVGTNAAVSAPAPLPALKLTRRRSRRLIAGLLILMVGGLSLGGMAVWSKRAGHEAEREARADQRYEERDFAEAAVLYRNLLRDFPDSEERQRYRFLAEWCEVRDAVYQAGSDAAETAEALKRLTEFLAVHEGDPLLESHHPDIWLSLSKLQKELGQLAASKGDRGLLQSARQAFAAMSRYKAPAGSDAAETMRRAEAALRKLSADLAARERRLALVDELKALLRQPGVAAAQRARRRVAQEEWHADPECQALVQEIIKAHVASVRFVAANAQPPPKRNDLPPSLALAPAIVEAKGSQAGSGRNVFAVARGVLYAFDAATGQPRWWRRVGADVASLPVRLPATPARSEWALVASADPPHVAAIDVDSGKEVWRQMLPAVCLGQPVVAGDRALAATHAGTIEEIDVRDGRRLGAYQVGQPLTGDGVPQPGTALVCFPAVESCVYIVDAEQRQCTGVLYTDHAAGTLAAPPLVLRDSAHSGRKLPSFLLVCLNEGGKVETRSYALPITHAEQGPLAPPRTTRGRLWASPSYDGENVAWITDAGVFSWQGVRLQAAHDPLFARLKSDYLFGFGKEALGTAQVAHAEAGRFWMLTQGRLHHLEAGFDRRTGPILRSAWPAPVPLGFPLHPAQSIRDNDRLTLYLATQERNGPTCLLTAVDAQTGGIGWQRQLGLTCRGQPLAVTGQVLVRDDQALLVFDAGAMTDAQNLAEPRRIPFPEHVGAHQQLAVNAQGVVFLAWGDKSASLWCVQIQIAGDASVRSKDIALPAPIHGTPALSDDSLVLPLANGILGRVNPNDGAVVQGPNWRSESAEGERVGHVVSLGHSDFAVTDGAGGLFVLHWPSAKVWESRAKTTLPHRLIGSPVVMPGKDKDAVRLAVADTANIVTLFQAESLTVVQRWSLAGKLTAGPFVLGRHLACVLDRRRLVLLDPAKEQPVWEYRLVADVVGAPLLIDGMVVTANLAGQVLGLDLDNGQPCGHGCMLTHNVAPAAGPVRLAPGRLFLPLTDGTVLLLPVQSLREAD